MNWVILLGSPDISGGTNVIFEHATRALKMGIEITIVTETQVHPQQLNWHPRAKALTFCTYDQVKDRMFDVAIATWWPTVYELPRINARRYMYFVQSIESRFYPAEEAPIRKRADATYMMGLPVITEARWICEYLQENFDADAYLVPNGIRKDLYCLDGPTVSPRDPGRIRVLVEGPLKVPFKNVEKTIELVKQSGVDEIWLLTSSPVESYPGVDRVFSRIPVSETPSIYRSCDLIVKLSYVEGMFGPPLEMFHCGGTAITYDVSGYDEYIVPEKNALVARRDDEAQVVTWLKSLKEDFNRIDELKKNALLTAQEWPDWDYSSGLFVQTVLDIARRETPSQAMIANRVRFFSEYYEVAQDYRNKFLAARSLKGSIKNILHSLSKKV